ncbi:MAG TPA: endopeptidase [Castellaniella sp.]|uniref:Bbp19 family protein n=1 Tax=Castellaniella sp. TaxID=1955812 RepID=UPI002F0A7EA3
MEHADPTDLQAQKHRRNYKATAGKFVEDRAQDDWKWLMGSKRGRRIVWRLLEEAGVFRVSFNTNAMAMAFAEGNKNAGIRILAQVQERTPDLYIMMVNEAHDERRKPDDADHNDH